VKASWASSMSIGIDLLSAIGECHRRLQRHAVHLSEMANVRDVKHDVNMPDLKYAFRLEEYVDAELVSGEAYCWCLEITITKTNILVEADVRKIHSNRQDIVEALENCQFSTGNECSQQLPEIANRLCWINPL
jgi:hypothetical protein